MLRYFSNINSIHNTILLDCLRNKVPWICCTQSTMHILSTHFGPVTFDPCIHCLISASLFDYQHWSRGLRNLWKRTKILLKQPDLCVFISFFKAEHASAHLSSHGSYSHPSITSSFSSSAPPRGRSLKADQRSWRYIVWLPDPVKEVHLTHSRACNHNIKAFSVFVSHHSDSG